MSASELLAILLNTPDALALAQEMLAQAGDLQTLSRLPIPELRHWRGIGPVRALRLQAAFALGRRLLETPADDLPRVTTPLWAATLLWAETAELEQEMLLVICLNSRNRPLAIEHLYPGERPPARQCTREILRVALLHNAAALIVGRHCLAAQPEPTAEDLTLAQELAYAGKVLEVEVCDLVLVNQSRYVSLREQQLDCFQK